MSHHEKDMIMVTDATERIAHWILALSCLFCVITGLGLMFHAWAIIPTVLGGYYATKWMHIFSGVIFAIATGYAYFMWAKDSMFEKDDLGWMMQAGGYLWEAKNLPPVYKYNAGQKAFFWCVIAFGALIVVSGLAMVNAQIFPPMIARWAFMLHALSGLVIAAFIVIHIYLGTIGNPGTVGAMITGYCSRAWCQTHCPRWLEEKEKK
jgi:formate dehydrogenase subunit gamma